MSHCFTNIVTCKFFPVHAFIKYPAFAVCVASFGTGVGIGFYGAPTHLVARAENLRLGTPNEIAFLVSLFGIASTAARLLLTLEWCCRINKQEIYNIAYGTAFLLAGIANILSVFATSYVTYAAYSIVFGLMSDLWFALFGVVTKASLNPELFVAGLGLTGLCAAIGGLIGPACAGAIYDATGDYNNSFYFYGSFLCLGGLIMLLLQYFFRRRQKLRPKEVIPRTSTLSMMTLV